MKYNVEKIAEIHKKYLKSSGLSTDSRKIEKGHFFVALVGENFDGNKYAMKALEDGASYVLVSDSKIVKKHDDRLILVSDTLLALQELANFHRTYLGIPILAITGSNGKTTTKELCAQVLASQFKVAYTKGNFNNHIGVPLTLLSFEKGIEFGIVEMGANHLDEIAALCEIAEPNYGIITNIGRAHIGEFGSADNIRIAKLELFEHIKNANEFMFYNRAYKVLSESIEAYNRSVGYDLSFENGSILKIQSTEPCIEAQFITDDVTTELKIDLGGTHNVENVKAALAVAVHFGLDPKEIASQLSKFKAPENRSQWISTSKNKVFLDAYNANPDSVNKAVEYFENIAGERLLILGDMNELGEFSDDEHLTIYNKLLETGIDFYLVGQKFSDACKSKNDIRIVQNKSKFETFLKTKPLQNLTILIKASRGMKLETLVEYL